MTNCESGEGYRRLLPGTPHPQEQTCSGVAPSLVLRRPRPLQCPQVKAAASQPLDPGLCNWSRPIQARSSSWAPLSCVRCHPVTLWCPLQPLASPPTRPFPVSCLGCLTFLQASHVLPSGLGGLSGFLGQPARSPPALCGWLPTLQGGRNQNGQLRQKPVLQNWSRVGNRTKDLREMGWVPFLSQLPCLEGKGCVHSETNTGAVAPE